MTGIDRSLIRCRPSGNRTHTCTVHTCQTHGRTTACTLVGKFVRSYYLYLVFLARLVLPPFSRCHSQILTTSNKTWQSQYYACSAGKVYCMWWNSLTRVRVLDSTRVFVFFWIIPEFKRTILLVVDNMSVDSEMPMVSSLILRICRLSLSDMLIRVGRVCMRVFELPYVS